MNAIVTEATFSREPLTVLGDRRITVRGTNPGFTTAQFDVNWLTTCIHEAEYVRLETYTTNRRRMATLRSYLPTRPDVAQWAYHTSTIDRHRDMTRAKNRIEMHEHTHNWGQLIGKMLRDEEPDVDMSAVVSDMNRLGHNNTANRSKIIRVVARWNEAAVGCRLHHMTINPLYCGHWGAEDDLDDLLEIYNGEHVCDDCAQEYYRDAADTGEFYHIDDLYYHESSGCYYTYPEDEDEDEDNEYDTDGDVESYDTDVLDSCESLWRGRITPYTDFSMGVELEMTGQHGSVPDTLRQLGYDYAIAKSDGSLPSNGFEVVTVPAALADHIKKFSKWVPDSSIRAWDARVCGMHVHLDSRGFNASTLGKFIEFISRPANEALIQAVAGRHPNTSSNARDYCSSNPVVTANPVKTLKGKASTRYVMVNLENISSGEAQRLGLDPDCAYGSYNTVELRIFRATTKKARLLAQLEFAHAAVVFCRDASMRALGEAEFKGWLGDHTGHYPHLSAWLSIPGAKEKRQAPLTQADA